MSAKLGEDPQHLHHHEAGGGGGIEGLGGRAEGDPRRLQLLDEGTKLSQIAAQPIDPVGEEQVEPARWPGRASGRPSVRLARMTGRISSLGASPFSIRQARVYTM